MAYLHCRRDRPLQSCNVAAASESLIPGSQAWVGSAFAMEVINVVVFRSIRVVQ
jgi:hypothetical protein